MPVKWDSGPQILTPILMKISKMVQNIIWGISTDRHRILYGTYRQTDTEYYMGHIDRQTDTEYYMGHIDRQTDTEYYMGHIDRQTQNIIWDISTDRHRILYGTYRQTDTEHSEGISLKPTSYLSWKE